MRGLNGGVVHADDLVLDLDQHFFEGRGVRPAFFGREGRKAAVRLELRHKAPHVIRRTRQKQIDALVRQQDGALEVQRQRPLQQQRAQLCGVGQRGEQVGRDVENGLHTGNRRFVRCLLLGDRWLERGDVS